MTSASRTCAPRLARSAATWLLPAPIAPTRPTTGIGPLFHGPRGLRGGGEGRGRDRSNRRVEARPKGGLAAKGLRGERSNRGEEGSDATADLGPQWIDRKGKGRDRREPTIAEVTRRRCERGRADGTTRSLILRHSRRCNRVVAPRPRFEATEPSPPAVDGRDLDSSGGSEIAPDGQGRGRRPSPLRTRFASSLSSLKMSMEWPHRAIGLNDRKYW